MKLMILNILLILLIVILLGNNKKEGYSLTLDPPNLTGTWQIPSISQNKSRTIKLTQKINIITGSDYYCLGNGKGTIVHNTKLIWKWGNREETKMIGDIILEKLSDEPKAIQIKWQNGYSWNKILPADNISGQWEGESLSHGPITITQKNNNISAIYPVYGLFMGKVVNNRISIEWQNGTTVKGIITKNNIKWDSGIEWTKKLSNSMDLNVSNTNKKNSNINPDSTINKNTSKLIISAPPLELPKKENSLEEKKIFFSPLPPVIIKNGIYPELTNN